MSEQTEVSKEEKEGKRQQMIRNNSSPRPEGTPVVTGYIPQLWILRFSLSSRFIAMESLSRMPMGLSPVAEVFIRVFW